MFAVAVTDHSGVPAATGAETPSPRRGLGVLLDHVLASAQASGNRHVTLDRFLAVLDRARDRHIVLGTASAEQAAQATSTTPARTALVAAGDTDSVRELIGDRDAVALHTVTDVATWARQLRVGCLLAGAEPDGEASVNSLRSARPDHHDGPFTWTRPRDTV